eukprot:8473936-Alexandrium_andersonii.AAC.1
MPSVCTASRAANHGRRRALRRSGFLDTAVPYDGGPMGEQDDGPEQAGRCTNARRRTARKVKGGAARPSLAH